MVYESIDKPIDEALKAEAYWLYQATSKTPAVKRFKIADEKAMQNDMKNQRNWDDLVLGVQEIQWWITIMILFSNLSTSTLKSEARKQAW